MYFFDTETIGFNGPIVLIQYAQGMGEIELHDVWYSPIQETLDLIEDMCYDPEGVCGFNLAFDWFHICQTYTTLDLLAKKIRPDSYPIEHVNAYALCEAEARTGPCLKPHKAFDLWLYARRGPYQTTMDRKDLMIKKVPTLLAGPLAEELDKRIPLKDIYFAKKSDPSKRWVVRDITDEDGEIVPDFKNVVLSFQPSSGLKALAGDALGYKDEGILKFTDVGVSAKARPKEFDYAPFATAIGKPGNWGDAWPKYLEIHANHWRFNKLARKYGRDDVVYTRDLALYFGLLTEVDGDEAAAKTKLEEAKHGSTVPDSVYSLFDDDDSILACMAGAVRWRGYSIDVAKLKGLRDEAQAWLDKCPHSFGSPQICRIYMEEVLSDTEKAVLLINDKITTGKEALIELMKWKKGDVCNDCYGMGCEKCKDGVVYTDDPHPAAERAREIMTYRQYTYRRGIYDKLIAAGRFHAAFNVGGTLSNRMSGGSRGGDGQSTDNESLNSQGIPHEEAVRSCFKLADSGFQLDGGDFAGFEVCLMDAVYADPALRDMLMSGKKIHGIFGTFLFPPLTYDEICATKDEKGEKNLYGRSKGGVFALAYGGEAYTLHTRVGVDEDVAQEAYANWCNRFKVWGENRQKAFDRFCSMRQPGGIGSRVVWATPDDYAESMLGFRRYFTLENQIVKALFEMANSPPETLKGLGIKVQRRDRIQTASGAVCSALYASAFSIQANNMRAAANHEIQSSGAGLTKKLQCRIWGMQSRGITRWEVVPMNIHDEIMAPVRPERSDELVELVNQFVEDHKDIVPLLEIEWKQKLTDWSGK